MEENNENNDNIVSQNQDIVEVNQNKKFQYHGENGAFFIIYLKNMLLTFITLGLYYPWAKVEILKYHYQNTQLEDSRFQFTGTGKEVFRGFIKVYVFVILFYIIILYAASTQNMTLLGIVTPILYLALFAIIPLAIHGAMRYRSSRSVYSGIHFKYLGDRMEFFKLFLKGIFFTIITFGIYSAWFQVKMRKYIYDKLRFGNVTFKFNGDGTDLFVLTLKGVILSYITLGIYIFWFYKNLIKYYVDHTKVIQNGVESNLNIELTGGEIFKLLFVNILIVMFTFGLGAPIAVVRTMKFMFGKLELNGAIDLNNIQQGSTDDYDDASGEDMLDFFDIDML